MLPSMNDMPLNAEWIGRLDMYIKALKGCFYEKLGPIAFSLYEPEGEAGRLLSFEQAEACGYLPISEGAAWGGAWRYGWFKGSFTLPGEALGSRVVMELNLGGEASLYLNGKPFGTRRADWVLEKHHHLCDQVISHSGVPGTRYDLYAEAFTGHFYFALPGTAAGPLTDLSVLSPGNYQKPRLGQCSFGVWNEEAYQLYLDIQALYDIYLSGDKNSLRTAEIGAGLKHSLHLIEFEEGSARRTESFILARAVLAPLMRCVNGSTAPTLYAFGHAHIDVCWLWDINETKKKCLRTFAAQIRMMDMYPGYKFLQSEPVLYAMIKELYPGLYADIKERIKRGQWLADGAMWVEPDTNIPSGESLIRQFLYGKAFFRDELGVDSRFLWLPDVFGYSAALPQIMAGCGVDSFSTCKLDWNYNGGESFPYNHFYWEGLDGTRILSSVQNEYTNTMRPADMIGIWNGRHQKDVFGYPAAYGYGDGGGGPCRDHVEYALRMEDLEGAPKINMEGPSVFFERLRAAGTDNVYSGELYFPCHRGTYTSQAAVKRAHRKAEISFHNLELALAMLRISGGSFDKEALDRRWKTLLTCQFHDILPGSSIERVNREAEEWLNNIIAENEAELAEVLRQLPGDNGTSAFNPLGWSREAFVKAGEKLIKVRLEPFGFTPLLSDEPTEAERCAAHTFAENAVLENNKVMVIINALGAVVKLLDKAAGTDYAAAGPLNRFRMFRDIPRKYDAWDIDSMAFDEEIPLEEPGTLEIVTEGGLEARVRLRRSIHNSVIVQDIYIRSGKGDVLFETALDWHETHKLLKTSFPSAVRGDCAYDEIQFGHLKRPIQPSKPYDKERFEVSHHKWAAVCEEGRGVGLYNDCKYGISHLGNTLDLTLLKSAPCPDPRREEGEHRFSYGFCFWNGSFLDSDIIKKAYEFNYPPVIAPRLAQGGLCSADKDNVIIETVKPSEDGAGIVARLYEAKRTAVKTRFAVHFPCKGIVETDMLENVTGPVTEGNEITLDMGPFKVKTIKILLEDAADETL
ncbi:MAG: glycosyl hydrolase-related protein [Clostridiales bacterium]|jgi:alpha-mannosidase|nr:glycosyl hydrolase-related protein [Clostridiales bacterium]